jgi:hypothetical protein
MNSGAKSVKTNSLLRRTPRSIRLPGLHFNWLTEGPETRKLAALASIPRQL